MTGKGTRLSVMDGARFALGACLTAAAVRVGVILSHELEAYQRRRQRRECDHSETTDYGFGVMCKHCGMELSDTDE